MKIVLPVAGSGVRLRPYTEDRPKCLLPVAGKTIIDWIVEDSLPLEPSETIFITGYKADQMDDFLKDRECWGKTRTVRQENPQGLGEAISLALPFVNDDEPMLVILGDTLFEADLSILKNEQENVLYTFKVKDPSRFGVAVTDGTGSIQKLVEKPQEFVSDEAIVGIYFIKDVKVLKESLKYLMDNNVRTKDEFQLTDALEMMLQKGCKDVLNRNDNSKEASFPGTTIEGPCHIGKDVVIENCKIGPNVAVGDGCVLKNCTIKNAILWDRVQVKYGSIQDTILHR